MSNVEGLKAAHRFMWAAGEFDQIAQLSRAVGREVVEAAAVSAGDRVLDVAAGTGNAALPAAERGASVVASDLTPELLEVGRARADALGLELEWEVADAEALPYDDAAFDVVLSTFGAMFAPRHAVAARELARVCRPGGRLALATWQPASFPGRLFGLAGELGPPPPDFASPPGLWGDEGHVRELLGDAFDLSFEHREVVFAQPDRASFLRLFYERFGPLVMLRMFAESQGRVDEFESKFEATVDDMGAERDGRFELPTPYLLVRGTRR